MENAAFKECPFCKEQIRKEAVKCRFCGEWLNEGHQPKADPDSEEKPKLRASLSNGNQESTDQSLKGGAATITSVAPTLEPLAGQVRTPPNPRNKIHSGSMPLIPLLLIALWVFSYVMPLAIKTGASGFLGIILATLSYCTTPGSLLVLPILGIWFWSSRHKCLSAETAGTTCEESPRQRWLIAVLGLCVVVLTYQSIRPALESRAAIQRQRLLASGVNPDALKGWEVMKRDQKLGDAATGLTPAAKKRMREIVALQLRGSIGAFTNLSVDLQGDNHEGRSRSCRFCLPEKFSEDRPQRLCPSPADEQPTCLHSRRPV